MIKQIIRWFRKLEEEAEKERMKETAVWKADNSVIFKTKFRCTNCKHIFEKDFRKGESIYSQQHWRGHFAYLNTNCPNTADGFIRCPLCDQDECRVIRTDPVNIKKEKIKEVQILP